MTVNRKLKVRRSSAQSNFPLKCMRPNISSISAGHLPPFNFLAVVSFVIIVAAAVYGAFLLGVMAYKLGAAMWLAADN
jgi:hypothetical protein